MVFPLYDHSPFKWPTPPYITWLLIALNVFVFLLLTVAGSGEIVRSAALVPAAVFGQGSGSIAMPAPLTLFTYTFLHANLPHIAGNMIFLFVFGDDIEEAIGHARFVVFYLVCGAGAGLAFALSDPSSHVALIGASGAVAGIVAAYLMLRPCASVTVLVLVVPVRMRAFWLIGGWAIWQFLEVASRTQDGVAYWAHVGGLATGAVLLLLMRPAGVRLFECVQTEPFARGTLGARH
jgi:membrane associated rhomboid family serine protease